MRALAGELKHSGPPCPPTGRGGSFIRYSPPRRRWICGHATIVLHRPAGRGHRAGDVCPAPAPETCPSRWARTRCGWTAPRRRPELFGGRGRRQQAIARRLRLSWPVPRPTGRRPGGPGGEHRPAGHPAARPGSAALERAEQNEGGHPPVGALRRWGCTFCPSTPDAAAHCRNFAPVRHPGGGGHRHLQRGADPPSVPPGLTAAGRRTVHFVRGEDGRPSRSSAVHGRGDGVKVQVGGRVSPCGVSCWVAYRTPTPPELLAPAE